MPDTPPRTPSRMPSPAPTPHGIAAAGVPGSGLQLLQGALLTGAVLYFGRELLIPLVLAVLLSFVLAPVTRLLRRVHLPRAAALLVALALPRAGIFCMGALVAGQAASLAEDLPAYHNAGAPKLGPLQAAGGGLDRIT